MVPEVLLVEKYIYDALRNDAQLVAALGGTGGARIFPRRSPENPPWPHIVMVHNTTADTGRVGSGGRIMSRVVMAVIAKLRVPKGASALPLSALAGHIDRIITGASAPTSVTLGDDTRSVQPGDRETEIYLTSEDREMDIIHLGGLYHFYVDGL